MVALITSIIQLLLLVFKSWSEFDAEQKKKNEEKREGWKDAVKSGDISVINSTIDRMRK